MVFLINILLMNTIFMENLANILESIINSK